MNLILAIFWLVVALGLFLYPLLNPKAPPMSIGGSGVSFAWLAVVLCCYNLVRWWLIRLQKRERKKPKLETERPRREVKENRPDFDFK